MDLTPYVDHLRRELVDAAEAGDPDARALAQRLTWPLESATRLTLLEALSAAADEITRDLAPGSVDMRLRGGDPAFVVTPPPTPPATSSSAPSPGDGAEGGPEGDLPSAPPPAADEGGTARITLRLPEHLKLRAEEAAGRQGVSVNAWLVRSVSTALDPGAASRRAGRPQAPRNGRGYAGRAQ
ncbi:toxin-antitoxin system HicB family antitoxin [Actinomadura rubrisoli]|uniref:Toxin-antitoxin system HicB family antitoxin n=1 Tax=Actinomadura rubrisoli TaxID=2530368 RepID=A0A4R5BWC2_9ACTN|nr:toxin-antitoxin system HicB family antitoxin [Actinomadura rubrisoli]TDD91468.1 toxin-antitoxin system HicB family antitoxin [Actinomadura rubrisoli]